MVKFDWKDSLLIAAGFVVCVTIASTIERWVGIKVSRELMELIVYASILGFPLARRRLWGEPQLPEPRRGFFASLLSIIGLLATIAGMALLAIFGPRLFEDRPHRPDFLTQGSDTSTDQPLFEIIEVGEDPDEARARQQAEIDRYEKEREALNVELLDEWHRTQEEHENRDRMLSALALGLLGFGALAIHLRYR